MDFIRWYDLKVPNWFKYNNRRIILTPVHITWHYCHGIYFRAFITEHIMMADAQVLATDMFFCPSVTFPPASDLIIALDTPNFLENASVDRRLSVLVNVFNAKFS